MWMSEARSSRVTSHREVFGVVSTLAGCCFVSVFVVMAPTRKSVEATRLQDISTTAKGITCAGLESQLAVFFLRGLEDRRMNILVPG